VVIKQAKGKLLKKVIVSTMGDIIDGMMGYIPLHVIMEKILADHGNHPFGDFRPTILNMLSAYGYERTILRTAKHLIEEDSFYNINALRQSYTHGYAASSSICCICGLGLEDGSIRGPTKATMENSNGKSVRATSRGSNAFSIYSCGHAAHIVCIADEASNKADTGSLGCPVCSLKVKSSTSSHLAKKPVWKAGDEAGDEANIGSTSSSSGTMAAYFVGSAIKSNHRATEVSRLAMLKQLQQGKQLSDLGPSLKLHLAPPQKSRPRRASIPESSGTSRSKSAQKISMSLRR
jgi:hypothetical protein